MNGHANPCAKDTSEVGNRVRLTILVITIVLLAAGYIAAQDPNYTITIDVPLVSLEVSVSDPWGQVVHDLTAEDFELYEDGVPQELSYFRPTSVPYNVLLLFDKSGSTSHKWDFMQRAISAFIGYLKPQDHVAIGIFEQKVKMLSDWTQNREEAVTALDRLPEIHVRTGTTEFYRSLDHVLRKEFLRIPHRRALVVLTDGRDTSLFNRFRNLDYPERARKIAERREKTAKNLESCEPIQRLYKDKEFMRLYQRAKQRRIPVYFIAVNTDRNLEPNTKGGDEYQNLQILFRDKSIARNYLLQVRLRMETIAQLTGGRILFPQDFTDVIPLYERIGRELSRSYSLGYISKNKARDSSFRRIEVQTRDGNHHISQSRDGYSTR